MIKFGKLEAEEHQDISGDNEIVAVPTIIMFQAGKSLGKCEAGINPLRIWNVRWNVLEEARRRVLRPTSPISLARNATPRNEPLWDCVVLVWHHLFTLCYTYYTQLTFNQKIHMMMPRLHRPCGRRRCVCRSVETTVPRDLHSGVRGVKGVSGNALHDGVAYLL